MFAFFYLTFGSMIVDTKYEFGEMVKLKHDSEGLKRMVVAVTIAGSMLPRYCLVCGINESWHYDF